jgi:peptidoglycan hydrolase-like protein with peptidoglycan-binding domain
MKLQRVISLRMSGEDVRFLQNKLKEFGIFREKVDGFFGQNTLMAVTNFQRKVSIKPDGMVGPLTWSQLLAYNPNPTPLQVENAKLESKTNTQPVKNPITVKEVPLDISYIGDNGLTIYDCLLTDEEYIKKQSPKDTIWLHHTAGGSRPDWTIGGWEKDYIKDKDGNPILDSKGNLQPLRVATHFVIGRSSSSSDEKVWDGKIVKAFDDRYWAYHLGISKNSEILNSRSISIELCNYGPLTISKDGRFLNYVNREVAEKDVVKLSKPFRGYTYWEKYTDKQLDSLSKLITYLQNRWNIEIERGIYNEDWFNYDDKWFIPGGLRSHTQVRRDKFDLFPQKELIQMLNSL